MNYDIEELLGDQERKQLENDKDELVSAQQDLKMAQERKKEAEESFVNSIVESLEHVQQSLDDDESVKLIELSEVDRKRHDYVEVLTPEGVVARDVTMVHAGGTRDADPSDLIYWDSTEEPYSPEDYISLVHRKGVRLHKLDSRLTE